MTTKLLKDVRNTIAIIEDASRIVTWHKNEHIHLCEQDEKNIITALRFMEKCLGEPSEQMVKAFNDTINVDSYGKIHNPKNVFKAMVQQALKEVEDD